MIKTVGQSPVILLLRLEDGRNQNVELILASIFVFMNIVAQNTAENIQTIEEFRQKKLTGGRMLQSKESRRLKGAETAAEKT